MSLEDNKAIVYRFFEEAANKGNRAVADELVADDFINHNPGPGQTPDCEGFKQSLVESRNAFPDIYYNIEQVIAEGIYVVVRFIQKGTHLGQWGPETPTGRQFEVSGVHTYRITDGKLAELWSIMDIWSMAMQLGLLPSPGQQSSS